MKRVLIREQNKSNKKLKQNERKPRRQKIIDEDFDLDRFFELAISDEIYVESLSLEEIKNEFLLDSKGYFESNGLMIIGPIEHKTNTKIKFMDDFESYIIAIDIDHSSEDVTLTGYVCKLSTREFNEVNRF